MDISAAAAVAVRAQVHFSWALMLQAEYASGLAPAGAVVGPAEHVLTARRLKVHQVDVDMFAVMLDRARGGRWVDIAQACGRPLGETRAVFEPLYERFATGENYPWRPAGAANMPQECPTDLIEAAATVDAWYTRVTPPLGLEGFGRKGPVSAVLARA